MENANAYHSYVIHSDAEPLRLDRQARLYGIEDDLRHARLINGHKVLDAGCGSGSAARLFARQFLAARSSGSTETLPTWTMHGAPLRLKGLRTSRSKPATS